MTKKSAKPSLRELALAPLSGFRKKQVSVPEWGATVTIREPSAAGWLEWRQLFEPHEEVLDNAFSDTEQEIKKEEAISLTPAQQANRNLKSDVILFIDILLDEDLKPVFTLDDKAEVEAIYGPVHSRLLRQALDLGRSEDIEKKSEPQEPSS